MHAYRREELTLSRLDFGGWTESVERDAAQGSDQPEPERAQRGCLRMMDTRASPLLAARDVGRAASHGTLVFRQTVVCAMIATTCIGLPCCPYAAQLLHSSYARV